MRPESSTVVRSLRSACWALLVAAGLLTVAIVGCGGTQTETPVATGTVSGSEEFTPSQLAKMRNMEPDEVAEYKKARLAGKNMKKNARKKK